MFLGYYYAAQKQDASAVDQCAAIAEQVKKQWPDEKFGYLAMADVGKLRNDMVYGEKALCELVDRPAWAKSPEPSLALAEYYAAFQRTDLQELAYRNALERDNQSVTAQNTVATFLMTNKRYTEALGVLNGDSPSPVIRHKVIACLIDLNQNDQAVKACESWLEIHPEDDAVWYNKGLCLSKLRAAQPAIDALSQALRLNAGNLKRYRKRAERSISPWGHPPLSWRLPISKPSAIPPVEPSEHRKI